MPLQLDNFDQLPPELAHIDVREIRQVFPNPSLIHLKGEIEPPLFISTLLHGNETTSFRVLQHLQRSLANRPPRRSVIIFVGNVKAAEVGARCIDGEPDFNRIWSHGETPHHALAKEVLSVARRRGVFASIDVHNNTGRNPIYGCVNSLRPQDLHLAAAFAPIGVFYRNPPTTQSIAFSQLGPAITLECGQVGDEDGLGAALNLIDQTLKLDDFPHSPPAATALELFETVGRVVVDPEVKFAFGASTDAGLVLRYDLEDLNFKTVEAGSTWANLTNGTKALRVIDEHGSDLTTDFFETADQRLRLRQPVVPAMITSDENIIRQDCLCYLMKPLDWHTA